MLPLQIVFLAAKMLLSLVGIGREMNQAGYLNYPPVFLKPIPTRACHFWLTFLIELTVYTYHPSIE
jgi:hypothetical protein